MILGLTGKNASGKTEIAKYLASKGFAYHSLSDAIRDEATRRGLPHSRENLIQLGNELRERHGPAVLAQMTRKKLSGRDVVDSIRNPSEVAELRKERGFFLIGVDAPAKLRFERAKKRGRAENADTLEEFLELERRENSGNEKEQQLDRCFEMADFVIYNSGTLEELRRKVDEVLAAAENKKA